MVANQVIGNFEARGAKIDKYLAMAMNFLTEFRAIKIKQVGRNLNSHADALERLALVFKKEAKQTIVVELILVLSLEIPQESIIVNTELGLSWMDQIVNFIQHDKLLEDKREVHKIRVKAARF